MNKNIVDLVDHLVDGGMKNISLSPNQYRTFVRRAFGQVLGLHDHKEIKYKGVTIEMWEGEDNGE
jgi:hypothetical protein